LLAVPLRSASGLAVKHHALGQEKKAFHGEEKSIHTNARLGNEIVHYLALFANSRESPKTSKTRLLNQQFPL
jgi:hypothetical protein